MTLMRIREAVVATAEIERAVAFYERAFGFGVVERADGEVLLGAPGASSGMVRLVGTATPPSSDPDVWDPGARLLGIYSHDLTATVEAIGAAGGTPRQPVTYPYGEGSLSEVVAYGRDGVWWTIPKAVPGAHRPSDAYDANPERLHSELHTVVLVVEDHDAAVTFFKAAGMTAVFDGTMSGPVFEDLVGMPAGASLRLAFLGGPEHLAARLEIMSFQGVAASDGAAAPRREGQVGIRRIVFECDDLIATRTALLDAGAEPLDDGVLAGPVGVEIALVEEGAA